ncbi:maleylpyruvate isomerase family mycothiol-dependent enzyme [Nocardioides piscis]|uniref:Maleylpyruvate isomerase family mycothiol-dependent enzyme n=1 Tax=Nocardioides piscis TaxID=2714938 RepID=A0A6G7YIR3_9ACTN|nr:maleylpyruvate isomerase family mycothiol-dependent enzyme [Nocardioides piscis]QIK76634.1 maleylpyruvate isomerase family mycothiol-dependent enzyme [Nocardioides piscis]
MTQRARPPYPLHLQLLDGANQRLVSTVEALEDATFTRPSLLPGWSVGHVLAHLALNAEALAGALAGIASGAGTPMYESQDRRDRDIADLGAAAPAVIRDRVIETVTLFDDQVASLPPDRWATTFSRTPGGQVIRARSTVLMRLREVDIHHADLGLAYTHADWSPQFSSSLIDYAGHRVWSAPFHVHADDLDQDWDLGEGKPEVTVRGPSHELGWWLTGRGDGAGLVSDSGVLPTIEPW